MMIDRGRGVLDAVGNRAHRRRLVAVSHEHLARRLQDLPPGIDSLPVTTFSAAHVPLRLVLVQYITLLGSRGKYTQDASLSYYATVTFKGLCQRGEPGSRPAPRHSYGR